MKIEEYEKIIAKTDISDKSLQFYLDGMSEESGEISGVFKRVRRGDFGSKAKEHLASIDDKLLTLIKSNPKIKKAIESEIGDREWYTNRFLNKIGSSLPKVLGDNAKKVKRRKKEKKIMGEGSDR